MTTYAIATTLEAGYTETVERTRSSAPAIHCSPIRR
jgi:hypothetical protein